jgi:hypothetical protein
MSRHRVHLTAATAVATLVLLASSPPASGEVFSSASDLKEVFHLERELVGILHGYAKKLESRLGMINEYLDVS